MLDDISVWFSIWSSSFMLSGPINTPSILYYYDWELINWRNIAIYIQQVTVLPRLCKLVQSNPWCSDPKFKHQVCSTKKARNIMNNSPWLNFPICIGLYSRFTFPICIGQYSRFTFQNKLEQTSYTQENLKKMKFNPSLFLYALACTVGFVSDFSVFSLFFYFCFNITE